jgi:hypothetical protein
MFFFWGSCVILPTQASKGILALRHVYFDVIGLPAVALGLATGTAVYNHFDTKLCAPPPPPHTQSQQSWLRC